MDKNETRLETIKLIQRILDMTNDEFAGILGIAPTWWATIKSGKAPLNGDYVLLIHDKFPREYELARLFLTINSKKPQEISTTERV